MALATWLWLGLVTGAEEGATVAFVAAGQPLAVREEGGAWQRDDGYLERQGPNAILWGDRAIGAGDFTVTIRLAIHGLARSAASVTVNSLAHLGFEGADGQPFLSGGFFGRSVQTLEQPLVKDGVPFEVVIQRVGEMTRFTVDGRLVREVRTGADRFGGIGLRPWRSQMRVVDFLVEGQTEPLWPARTQPAEYTIPTVDLAGETDRQVVIARGSAEVYQGHPTTLLMPDGQTMFCVWTYDHGGRCGPLKRSDDGGLTWSDLLPVPENWSAVSNCPALHRLVDPAGVVRLFVFAGTPAMQQSVSLDGGRTWSPFEANGLRCVVAPLTILPIAGHRHVALYHRGPDSRDRSPLAIWQSISADGGLTWGPEEKVAERDWADLCEPAMIRSPDGRTIACLMRENARRFNSHIMFSHDEAATWSEPVELPAALTGDRHMPRYTPDGRLMMVFRDTSYGGATRGDFVGWVGTWDDLVDLREGQYRFRLWSSPRKFDLGYPGLERLPDGTMVATTYAVMAEGEQNSVLSWRFTVDELDQRLAAGQLVSPPAD